MGPTNQSNNFIIYNITLHYNIQFLFNELEIQKITHIIDKNINQITFYFVEEGLGRGSEDVEKECNVNRVFFSVFLMDVMGGKISQLKRTALKQKKKKHMHTGKVLEAH